MPGGSTNTGSTTSFTSQPGVNNITGTALKLFNSGAPFTPDTTSHVTPFAKQTTAGLTGMNNVANASWQAMGDQFNRINSTVKDGGLNNLQDQQVARLQGQAGGTGLNAMQQRAYNDFNPTANGMNAEQQAAYRALTPTGNGLNAEQQRAYNQLTPTGNGLNAEQQAAYNSLTPTGNGLNAEQQAIFNAFGPTANGLNAEQQAAYNAMGPTANGLNNEQQSAYEQIKRIASGAERSGNPYVEDIIRRNNQDISLAGQLDASGRGRYGSGAAQGVIADAIGDNASKLRYQNYTDETGRMDSAMAQALGAGTQGAAQRAAGLASQFGAGSQGANQRAAGLGAQAGLGTQGALQRSTAIGQQANLGTQGAAQRSNAIGEQANLGTQGATQRSNAIGQQANLGTQGATQRAAGIGQQLGIGNTGASAVQDAIASLFNAGSTQRQNTINGTQQLSDAYNARLQPFQTQLGVGKAYEDKNSQVLADQARIQAERKGALTAPVNWLSSLLSGYNGGQTTTNTQQPKNTFGNVLGGALGGFDLFGGPGGAIAGGLGGLFA